MENPFLFTTQWIKFVADGFSDAFKRKSVAYGICMAIFGYIMIPAIFIIDLCIFAPLTVIFAIFAPEDKKPK